MPVRRAVSLTDRATPIAVGVFLIPLRWIMDSTMMCAACSGLQVLQ